MRLRMLSGCVVVLIALACVPMAPADTAADAGSASKRAASCGGLQPTLKGSKGDDKGDDRLKGTGGEDVISASRGNDLAIGRGGDDVLCGGPGKDVLKGGAGDDLCIGGPGRDKMRGCEPALVAPPPVSPPPPTVPPPPDVNDAPVLNTGAGSPSYTENGSAEPVAPNLTITDDSTNLSGATVTISAGSAPGDQLVWFDEFDNIDATGLGTGTITFTGTAPAAAYQAALRAVAFRSTSENPGNAARTVSFMVTDSGALQSAPATKGIAVTPVNDAPAVAGAGAINYTEGAAPAILAPNLTVADPDSLITGATVTITSPQGQETLEWDDFSGQINATGGGTSTITFTGSATPAEYQAQLRTVVYRNLNDTPSTPRSVTFRVTDAGGAQSVVNTGSTVTVNVTPVNDVPIITGAGSTVVWTVGGPAVQLAPSLLLTDGDSGGMTGATVTSATPQAGDALEWQDAAPGAPPDIASGQGTATLTLTGLATTSAYQAALRQVTFRSTSGAPSPADRTIRFQVTDSGGATSGISTANTTTVDVVP